MITYKLTWVNSKFDNLPKELNLSRYGLLEFLYPAEVEKKQDTILFSPCWYKRPYRRGEYVDKINMIVFDVDGGYKYPSIEDINPAARSFLFLIYPTFSYTEDKPKYRVIIPLSNPVPAKYWKQIYHPQITGVFNWLVNDKKANLTLDMSCSDPNRLYYLPSIKKGNKVPDPILNMGENYTVKYTPPPPPDPRPKRFGFKGAKHGSHQEINTVIAYKYNHDRDTRLSAAADLGCTIKNNRAEGFSCPWCQGTDTYFYTESNKTDKDGTPLFSPAACKHEKTCGYRDSLYNLMKDKGLS